MQAPEKEPVEEIVPDEPVPEEPGPGREKGGVRNIFIFGLLNYLKGLFSPFALSDFAKETEPTIEYYWYRETAAAGLSDKDITMVQALDLAQSEERSVLNARIPAVYTGWRNTDTYELTRYVNDTNREHTQVLMEYLGSGSGTLSRFARNTRDLSYG